MATSRKDPIPENRENGLAGPLADGSPDLPGMAKARSKAVPAPKGAATPGSFKAAAGEAN